MALYRKGECSRQMVQHKKMTSDLASVCVHRKDRECKYQKMSVVGRLDCRFSGVQSINHKQSRRGNFHKEKRVCSAPMNQRTTIEEKQDKEKCGQF